MKQLVRLNEIAESGSEDIYILQENPACTKYNHQDKILLTNPNLDQAENKNRKRNREIRE